MDAVEKLTLEQTEAVDSLVKAYSVLADMSLGKYGASDSEAAAAYIASQSLFAAINQGAHHNYDDSYTFKAAIEGMLGKYNDDKRD